MKPTDCLIKIPILATLLFSFLACGEGPPVEPAGRAADGDPVAGGLLVVGSISDVDSWNEYLSRQSFTVGVLRRMYLPLAKERPGDVDAPPSFEPALAESWEFSEDGLQLTFLLGEHSWSDGRPVTADDVVFTFEAQRSPEVAWVGAHGKENIRSVAAVDASTVVFSYSRVYPERLIDAVEGAILPRHVFGKVPFERWRSHDWSTARIGSGPFLLEHHAPGDEIRMRRNPLYPAGTPPWIDRLVFRVVPDIGNLMTQLLAGHIDYMENIPPRDAGRIAAAEGVTVLPFNHPKYDYIGWNGSRAPFDDPEVRRALTLAIDREALVEDLLFGYGRVSAGPVPSFRWGADRTLVPWPHDPEKAKRLLASRGFVPSGEQGMLARDGVPLEFTLTTNAGNSLREAMLVKIQEQFRTLGVKVHVLPMEMRAWVEKNVSGDYDAYLGGWVFSGRVELEPLFGSAFCPPSGSNVVFYHSPEADRLLALLGEAVDWNERLPVMHRIQQKIHADQPYTFLYEVMRIAAAGPRVAGAEIENPADSLALLERVWIRP